jgi:hypothetical protein
LQVRDGLSSGAWTNVGDFVPGAGVPITLVHSNGASAQEKIYRVLVSP